MEKEYVVLPTYDQYKKHDNCMIEVDEFCNMNIFEIDGFSMYSECHYHNNKDWRMNYHYTKDVVVST